MSVLWQGDHRWGPLQLGEGGATIGAAGCLVTCIAQALRKFHLDENATPTSVQARARASGKRCFFGANSIIDLVGAANGLRIGELVSVDLAMVNSSRALMAVRDAIGAALASGLALLHVDKDSGDVGGDWSGDHWVLATSIVMGGSFDGTGDVIVYADPATAREARLSVLTLTGSTVWGVTPHAYVVRGMRAVHAMVQR